MKKDRLLQKPQNKEWSPFSSDKNTPVNPNSVVVISKNVLGLIIFGFACLVLTVAILGALLNNSINKMSNNVMASGLTQAQMVDLWNDHVDGEFFYRNVSMTMDTVGANPFMYNIPTRVGGNGTSLVDFFYSTEFIPCNPPDFNVVLITRTIGDLNIVDEYNVTFTHTTYMPWILPNIQPTNKYVQVPFAVIVGFSDKKIVYEHIYWDQASVLVQIGLLDQTCCTLTNNTLPILGAEEAIWNVTYY